MKIIAFLEVVLLIYTLYFFHNLVEPAVQEHPSDTVNTVFLDYVIIAHYLHAAFTFIPQRGVYAKRLAQFFNYISDILTLVFIHLDVRPNADLLKLDAHDIYLVEIGHWLVVLKETYERGQYLYSLLKGGQTFTER